MARRARGPVPEWTSILAEHDDEIGDDGTTEEDFIPLLRKVR
jgi:hypothetical protein